jgi:PKD-like domain/Concanavalin A-like lectin/glucanases superfamily
MLKIYSLFLWMMLCCSSSMMANPPSPREISHNLFASDVFQPANQAVCNGTTTNAVVFVSSIPGTIFNWVNNNTSIGLAASGTGNIAAFTAINTGTAPVVATIIVTPTDGVTNGTPKSFTITVNPIPSVNTVSDQTLCAGTSSTAVNLTGSVPGTIYSWVNSNPAIGLATSGSGTVPSFTATNTTTAPITATITATPSFGATLPELLYYKFEGSGTTVDNLATNAPAGTSTANIVGTPTQGGSGICGGTLIGGGGGGQGNHLNTNWTPNITGSWTISFRTANIPANGATTVFGCLGGRNMGVVQKGVDSWELQFMISSTIYKVEVPGTAGTGIHTTTYVYNSNTNTVQGYGDGVLQTTLSLPTALNFLGTDPIWLGGYGGSSFFLPAGALIDEFRMYNRVISSTEINQLANTCTPGTACSGSPVSFDITVNPVPNIASVPDQITCNNGNTIPVNFSSNVPGTIFNWTNNNPSIGLAASGTGNIPSFTGINTGNALDIATITVTAVGNTVPACSNNSETFIIGINPSPTASANTPSQTVCSGSANIPIIYTSNVSGTTYTWTRDNTAAVSGIGGNGAGSINGFFINNTNAPVTVTFTITPSRFGCTGTPFTATVTVGESIPPSTVSPATQTICSGPITDIIPSSTFQGITYNWTRDNVTEATGIPASGTGPISGTLVNRTTPDRHLYHHPAIQWLRWYAPDCYGRNERCSHHCMSG